MDKKTILIVDDDRDLGKMLGITAQMLGYAPILCAGGDEAIPHVKSVDILITDFNMPGMNGVELAKIAKQQNPDLPVVIMTGTPQDIPIDHLADEIVEKPFGIARLQEIITEFQKKDLLR